MGVCERPGLFVSGTSLVSIRNLFQQKNQRLLTYITNTVLIHVYFSACSKEK